MPGVAPDASSSAVGRAPVPELGDAGEDPGNVTMLGNGYTLRRRRPAPRRHTLPTPTPVPVLHTQSTADVVNTLVDLAALFGWKPRDFGYVLLEAITQADDGERDRLGLGFPREVTIWSFWATGASRPTVGEIVGFAQSCAGMDAPRPIQRPPTV